MLSRRLGLGRLAALESRPPVVRYQRARPGELLHIDTKKLGRIEAVGHRITGDRRMSPTVETAMASCRAIAGPLMRCRRRRSIAATRSAATLCPQRRGAELRSISAAVPPAR